MGLGQFLEACQVHEKEALEHSSSLLNMSLSTLTIEGLPVHTGRIILINMVILTLLLMYFQLMLGMFLKYFKRYGGTVTYRNAGSTLRIRTFHRHERIYLLSERDFPTI